MEPKRNPDIAKRIVMTACSSHCGGTCILKLHVKDGLITQIETDSGEDPQYRACLKGRAYRQRVYAPDRLKYPMKRVGERGKGEFERISWDEALDTVTSKIEQVRESYGSSAILYFASVGDVTLLNNAGLMERLLAKSGGYSGPWGSASGEGAVFAVQATYGAVATGNTRDDFINSRLIILWGWNPAVTGSVGNTRFYLAQAREAGIRIVCVDPRHTDSAAILAHQWIPVRPGTDAAMLIAMAYVIINEKLHDHSFLDKYTVGFEQYKDYVLGKEDGIAKTPAWAEAITGVPAETISGLAREYATSKPAALMTAFGPGRSAYGEQYHRAAITLAAMTGNIGIHGGNAPSHCLGDVLPALRLGPPVFASMIANNPVDDALPPRKESPFYELLFKHMPVNYYFGSPSSSRVNRFHMADAILKGRSGGYPADYKLLYMVNFNYVNQYANTNKIVKALKTVDFIVVQDQFMTPTAKFADILLPTNSFLERNDLTTGGIGPFYGYMNKAIDSLDESKSQYEIATELATRLGVTDFSDKTEEEWLRGIVAGCEDIPDYETFKKDGVHKVKFDQPYVSLQNNISDPLNNPFPTPSGKIEIYSQKLADMNNPKVPPIPKYVESWESRNDPLADKYPLQLVTTHTRRRAHTQFDNVPWLRELYPQAVSINTADADVRGINDGDMVRVFNDRGEMVIPARVTGRIMVGVVDIPQGAWYDPDENGVDRGGCANILTKDVISPGGAFASNTALVQVKRV
jgi:anaerobic dimethyl sulfoxide reductase subunit A